MLQDVQYNNESRSLLIATILFHITFSPSTNLHSNLIDKYTMIVAWANP